MRIGLAPERELVSCSRLSARSSAATQPPCRRSPAAPLKLCDPTRAESIAAAMRRVLEDEALRKRLRAAGIERARPFTWPAIARRTLDIYREVS